MSKRNAQPRRSEPGAGSQTTHVVGAGETLVVIAKRHGVTLKALLASNPQIKDPNRIKVGQRITLPSGQVVVPGPAVQPAAAITGAAAVGSVSSLTIVAAGDSSAFAAMDKRGKAKRLQPVFRERLVMLAENLAKRGMKALITTACGRSRNKTNFSRPAAAASPVKGRSPTPGADRATITTAWPWTCTRYARFRRQREGLHEHSTKRFRRVRTRLRRNSERHRGRGREAGPFWGARFMGIVDTPHVQLLAQHEMSPKECLKIFRANGNDLQPVWDEASRRVKSLHP